MTLLDAVRGGLDSNHTETPRRRWSHLGLLVGPLYHAMHHVYPESYFASTTRLFDFVFATGCQIRGRRFAITGASGAFGAPLARMLEAQGGIVTRLKFGRDYDHEDYGRLDGVL